MSLGVSDGALVLTVKDDGAGFAPGSSPHQAGMGMANLAARAAEVGGSLDVTSVPGGGTTVRFGVPCRATPGAPLLRPTGGRLERDVHDRSGDGVEREPRPAAWSAYHC